MVPRPFQEILKVKMTVIRYSLPFALSFSPKFTGVFQGLCDIRYHYRLDAASDRSIHLSSVKSEIQGICKNVKQCHPYYFLFWKIELFSNTLFLLMCVWFIVF